MVVVFRRGRREAVRRADGVVPRHGGGAGDGGGVAPVDLSHEVDDGGGVVGVRRGGEEQALAAQGDGEDHFGAGEVGGAGSEKGKVPVCEAEESCEDIARESGEYQHGEGLMTVFR